MRMNMASFIELKYRFLSMNPDAHGANLQAGRLCETEVDERARDQQAGEAGWPEKAKKMAMKVKNFKLVNRLY